MNSKVALVKCQSFDYDYKPVREAIQEAVEALGGFSAFLSPGERVMLKVNLLMKKAPEEATTTHPVFVEALADLVTEFGCDVLIADSPGGPFVLRMLESVYKGCGYDRLGRSERPEQPGIKLNRNVKSMERENADGYLLKRLTLIDALNDVDKVISVSKLKTHGMMKFTGAVKNMFGTVPGMIKAEYHFKMPEPDDFADMLVDICEHVRPVLSLMDGIVGMEGAGPSAGDPVDLGVVLASDNPHWLDMTAVKLVQIDPQDVPTLRRAVTRGLIDPVNAPAEMTGLPLKAFHIPHFKAPNIRSIEFLRGHAPYFIKHAADLMLKPRPVFDSRHCVKCGDCRRLCPPQAIAMDKAVREGYPVVDLSKCIRCYCCQELCPKEAVEIHRPLLLRLMTKF
ncbi:DUF362 domain-containing protein [Acidaminobacter sp.]|uniref:DUF362 domain-containing protein n=1 Tax=Acidaminobacter sp. TaxID=1872102 RepID=UPI0013852ECA|nr:DUF362 domain-containing protein [Acidaminobacter sp.]MDK9711952.1 DUF362 domain-containing protein [Acidaminobacter sp.]MZQ97650.1 DUF362 domain-containing protein [Acidaminobacter sp.]